MNRILEELGSFLNDAPFEYALCGGFAIDLYLDKETRKHSDIDISVNLLDKNSIIDFMISKGWNVLEAYGGGKVINIEGSYQNPNIKNLFCYTPDCTQIELTPLDNGFYSYKFISKLEHLDYLEFLFYKADNHNWFFFWDERITKKIDSAFCKGDIPYLAPELVLLFKAMNVGMQKNSDDFHRTIEKLDKKRRRWFSNSLQLIYPDGHEWIELINKTN